MCVLNRSIGLIMLYIYIYSPSILLKGQKKEKLNPTTEHIHSQFHSKYNSRLNSLQSIYIQLQQSKQTHINNNNNIFFFLFSSFDLESKANPIKANTQTTQKKKHSSISFFALRSIHLQTNLSTFLVFFFPSQNYGVYSMVDA